MTGFPRIASENLVFRLFEVPHVEEDRFFEKPS
jgi:hypothetical protein